MGRFEIATNKIPKGVTKEDFQIKKQIINESPIGRFGIATGKTKNKPKLVLTISENEKIRKIVIDHEDESERVIRRRTDAHPKTYVGTAEVSSNGQTNRMHNANEAFDSILDQLIDKKL